MWAMPRVVSTISGLIITMCVRDSVRDAPGARELAQKHSGSSQAGGGDTLNSGVASADSSAVPVTAAGSAPAPAALDAALDAAVEVTVEAAEDAAEDAAVEAAAMLADAHSSSPSAISSGVARPAVVAR